MKKAVMYGGGNIGRGFIGATLSQSGYEVTFIKKGFEMLGLDQNVVMQACIDGMTEHKDELGLK